MIWTDAAEFFVFMAGGLFTLFYIPTLMEGGWGFVMEKASEAGKLNLFNFEFSPSMPFNIWMGIIGATFVVLSSHGAEQLIVQRVLACSNVRDGRKALAPDLRTRWDTCSDFRDRAAAVFPHSLHSWLRMVSRQRFNCLPPCVAFAGNSASPSPSSLSLRSRSAPCCT